MSKPRETPLVSVIIPTYNQARFIRETIESVLSQSYTRIEVIVTDDGSTDATCAIVREYVQRNPDKVQLCTSPINTGIAGNFNRGLAVHRGKYIAWLGGDDVMLAGKIQKQVDLLESRPDAVGCCHDAEVFESQTGKVLGLFSELYNGRKGFREGGVELWLMGGYKMLPSTMMVRSSACPAHGFDERLVFANDWLFDIEVFRKGRCVVLNESLARYRRHDRNITTDPSTKASALEESMIVLGIVDARYPDLNVLVKRRRITLYLTEAVKSYALKDKLRFRQFICCSIRDRAWIRGCLTFLACHLFGSWLMPEIGKEAYHMPRWFVRTVNFFRNRA